MNTDVSRTAEILNLQQAIMVMPDNDFVMPEAGHCFAPGAYARTLIISEGELIIGKMHRHAHLNIISYGEIAVATHDGLEFKSGHSVFTSTPFVKRCVYAIKDTCWTTIHLTEETDLDKVEDDVIIKEGSAEFLSKIHELIGGDA